MQIPTLSVAVLVPTIRHLEERGVPRARVCRALGLAAEAFDDIEARIPYPAMLHFWDTCIALCGSPRLPFEVAQEMAARPTHVVGYLAISSATPRVAFARTIAYNAIGNDLPTYELDTSSASEHSLVASSVPGPATPTPAYEYIVALPFALLRAHGPTGFHVREVTFRHAPRIDEAAYREFFAAPVRFGAARDALHFDGHWLDQPMRGENANLAAILEYEIRARHELVVTRDRPSESMANVVRRAIVQCLVDGPSLTDIAGRLGLAARTLQRRLEAEHTSHAAILDEVRREHAERYLARSDLPLAEVSFLIGFGELTSFHRAFRRWHGTTPNQYRARLAAAASAPH